MGQITRDCPHCKTRNSAFTTYGEFIKPNIGEDQKFYISDTGYEHSIKIYIISLYCNGCFGGLQMEIEAHFSPSDHDGDLTNNPDCEIIKAYPKYHEKSLLDHLPNNVENFYRQAIHSLEGGSFDASIMMSRKALEMAIKRLDPNTKGGSHLYHQIEALAKKGLITKVFKDWAHIIRDDGNDAAHEEEPRSKESAQQVLDLTEIFLRYAFTMPGIIESRRQKDSAEAGNPANTS